MILLIYKTFFQQLLCMCKGCSLRWLCSAYLVDILGDAVTFRSPDVKERIVKPSHLFLLDVISKMKAQLDIMKWAPANIIYQKTNFKCAFFSACLCCGELLEFFSCASSLSYSHLFFQMGTKGFQQIYFVSMCIYNQVLKASLFPAT